MGVQDKWRWCSKCQGLTYAGNSAKGPCPAGGEHNQKGWNYTLMYDSRVLKVKVTGGGVVSVKG